MSDGHNAATRRGWLATINPVAKLAATLPPLALLLFTRDIATPAVVAGLALVAIVSGVPLRLRTLLAGAVAILLVGAWTTLVFALLTRSDLVRDSPIIIDGWITLRAAAVHAGASTAVRLAAMMMLALLGSLGTTTDQLASALVHQCRIPYRFAYGSIAAMRFAPRYRQELLTLRAAQRARGIIDPDGPVGYLRRTGRSIVPLLAAGARYATRLSLAMDARGFGAFSSRSDRQPSVVRARDVIFVMAVWAGIAAVFVTTGMLGLLAISGDLRDPG